MAVLSEADRAACWSDFMAEQSANHSTLGDMTKAELRALVDAVDNWVNDNAASFNAALPEPAKTELTARQKARMLLHVVDKRWKVS